MAAKHSTLMQDILNREGDVWRALVSGDAQSDAAALADDFLGIYADGFAGKADHVGQLANGPTVVRFEIIDPQFRSLGADHCVLSYRADFQRVEQKEVETMYVTSIWEQRGGAWVNVLSQDTAAERT